MGDKMRYMLLIYTKETESSPEEMHQVAAAHGEIMAETARRVILRGRAHTLADKWRAAKSGGVDHHGGAPQNRGLRAPRPGSSGKARPSAKGNRHGYAP